MSPDESRQKLHRLLLSKDSNTVEPAYSSNLPGRVTRHLQDSGRFKTFLLSLCLLVKLASCKCALTPSPPPHRVVYSTDRSKSVVPVLVLLCCFVVYSTRRFVLCLTLCHFVLVFFSLFSIARELILVISAFRTFARFVLVWICRFPLPLVWKGLRLVIVALPGLFSYLFFYLFTSFRLSNPLLL